MATRKSAKNNRKKVRLQPEEVYVARPKKVSVPKPAPKKKVKKSKPKVHIKKYARIRVRRSVFVMVVVATLSIAVAITWIVVKQSILETNKSLQASAKTANGMFIAAKTEADLIRIIGTKKQRASEIINFQSAPVDLQKFIMDDYKTFKKQCTVNGKISSDVGYELKSVIYDAYAVVKRTCNGTDTAILKKFGATWAIAFSGNVLPPCTVTNDLDIPQGASYYCTQDGGTYVNPNP